MVRRRRRDFDRLGRWATRAAALAAVLEEFQPELVHCHNLPDALTVLATDLAGRVPVIHDVHDLQSLRQTVYEDGFPEPGDPLDLERRAIEESDALVTVSTELLAEIRARYRVPGAVLVFPNYALERDLPPRSGEHPSDPPRLVYQGTLSGTAATTTCGRSSRARRRRACRWTSIRTATCRSTASWRA